MHHMLMLFHHLAGLSWLAGVMFGTVVVNPTFISETDDAVTLYGTLTLSGNYPVGGDTINFTSAIGYQSPNGRIFSASIAPINCQINGTGGDTFGFAPGTLLSNGKVIVNTATATVQVGAYGAEITGDTNIEFEATFQKLL